MFDRRRCAAFAPGQLEFRRVEVHPEHATLGPCNVSQFERDVAAAASDVEAVGSSRNVYVGEERSR